MKARIGIIVSKLIEISELVLPQIKKIPISRKRFMPSILSYAFVLAIATCSTMADLSIAQDQKTAKPAISNLEEALKHSANKQSPLQLEATLALGDFTLQDGKARPEVIELLMEHLQPRGNELVQSAAEISVRKIGKAMLPKIETSLTSSSLAELAAGCNAIRAIGPDAIELLPQLIALLQTDDTFSQRAALYALQGFDNQAFDSIDAVVACLGSHDFNVQCMACRVLEKYGSDALPAETNLVQILETGNPSSRGWAAIVLGAIGPTDENDVVPMLIARLSEAQAHVEKQRILLGLAHLGREAKRAVPVVTEYMNARQHRVKPHAAYALYKITGDQKVLVEVLSNSLNDINEKHDAFELVKRLGEESTVLKADLVKQLSSEEEDVREKAVLAIGRLGPAASDTLPKVKKLLTDSDVLVREAAAETIAAITQAAPAKENLFNENK